MALIKCPECGHQMSDTAKKCPNCGYSLTKYKFLILGIVIIFVGLILVAITLCTLEDCNPYGGHGVNLRSTEFFIECLIFLCAIAIFYGGCKLMKKFFSRSIYVFWGITTVCIVSEIIMLNAVGGINLNHPKDHVLDYSIHEQEDGVYEQEASIEKEVSNLMLGGHKLKGRMSPDKTMDAVFTFYNDKTMTVDVSHDNGASTQGVGTWERKKRSYHDVEYEWCELRYGIVGSNVLAIIDSELRLYGPIDGDEAGKYNMAELCAIMADKSDPKNDIIQRFITPLDIVK
ncbi:MAG: zinc ribbon domain-containing protein [Bacteroidales bacterium]|nr:zinc ribbon domain-containing protein [Bacteroidales bacterium]